VKILWPLVLSLSPAAQRSLETYKPNVNYGLHLCSTVAHNTIGTIYRCECPELAVAKGNINRSNLMGVSFSCRAG
jgi:hypothetical protein